MEQHGEALRAALIGDVIASRQTEDREGLQIALRRALGSVNAAVPGRQALTMTIGDEFQGAYEDLAAAFEAGLRLHLTLRGTADIRIGIGWGELYFGDETTPLDQDGPCWWRARQALDSLKGARQRPTNRRSASVTDTTLDPLLAGYLTLRDQVLFGIDEVDARIALGLMSEKTQSKVAAEIGLNKSSISRRIHGHGILALIESLPNDIRLPEDKL